jgi:hypothetical protein
VSIAELRQSALEAELLRLEELKKIAQEQSTKKNGKKESKDKKDDKEAPVQTNQTSNRSLFEEELKSDGKSLFSDETDTPDSDAGKKLW